ncbi:ABC transporter permease [Actinoplanes sp. SE50]|uniref:ABC transporter permease n=1 Tax=unclassified Actinoplanes TaxID=2626549 RepID=UPI00023EC5A4|nr:MULTISPECIES: ABC-2 family transporter protein [unclassified Actinoplanes]AEV82527.1 ABC-2 type transport system permease protein [Actinoplanes sp. SE50/110]ATO80923.1 ABC transporter permease [Actinoplanes sp. SE50]SLL98330.1 ABC transporter permease [Actinoplanes sp. SE50/110]
MGELRAYVALAAAQARSVLSYRASFLVELLANVGATVFDVLTVLVLFRATDRIGGFTLPEALLITGLVSAGFALADFAVGNVDRLKVYVRAGTLDAVLVRPLGALPQLLLMDLPIRKLLRVIFGCGVLVVAVRLNHIAWTPGRVVLVALSPLACAVFVGAIFVISASLAFWWVDSGELGSAFTYGGRDFASYPITVYGPWFRGLFAYGLGFAFVAYQPALALLGRPDPLGLPAWAGFAAPLVALVAAAVAAAVWRVGIRHYRSTGS